MATYYLDTSALVKRYVREPGSAWVTTLMDSTSGHDIYTVRLTGPEMIAAFFRKSRTGEISWAEARQAMHAFRSDWQRQFKIVEITPQLADQAMDLAEQFVLRGYDAMHVATALNVQAVHQISQLPPITFVSADIGQLQAVLALGLLTENPNNH